MFMLRIFSTGSTKRRKIITKIIRIILRTEEIRVIYKTIANTSAELIVLLPAIKLATTTWLQSKSPTTDHRSWSLVLSSENQIFGCLHFHCLIFRHWGDFPSARGASGGPPRYHHPSSTEYERPPPYYYPGP